MWITLGNDYVNLDTAHLIEVDGPMLVVRVPNGEFRGTDAPQTEEVEGVIRKLASWVSLELPTSPETRRAMYANLATTTSVKWADGEYRLYAGSTEYAAIGADRGEPLADLLNKRAASHGPVSSLR